MPSPATPTDLGPGPGYETRDVNPKAILWLVGSIVITVAATMVGLWLLMDAWGVPAARIDPSRQLPVAQTPPEPRLQASPARDYDTFLAEQEQQLSSYGWVDREKGVVRIPMKRSMDLAVKNGLTLPKKSSESDQQPAADPPTGPEP